MNIPKQLEGQKVQKFEDLSSDLLSEFQSEYLKGGDIRPIELKLALLLETNLFYCQQFNPEMIDLYFDIGLDKLDAISWGDEYIDLTVLEDETKGILVDIESNELENHTIYHSEPHTLADFISSCLNSGISLTWKK